MPFKHSPKPPVRFSAPRQTEYPFVPLKRSGGLIIGSGRLVLTIILCLLLLSTFVLAKKTFIITKDYTTTTIGGNASNITDTDNYTTGISFNRTGSLVQLNLARNYLPNLSATFTDQTGGGGATTTLPLGNITGLNTSQCGGTDKVVNVTFDNGDLSIVCASDVDTDDDTTYTNGTGLKLTGVTFSIQQYLYDNWNNAYGWGDHSLAGYLTSYTETDPKWVGNYSGYNKTSWDTAYSWGDHGLEGYSTGAHTIDTDTNCNASGSCADGDVAYMDYSNTGDFTASGNVSLHQNLSFNSGNSWLYDNGTALIIRVT